MCKESLRVLSTTRFTATKGGWKDGGGLCGPEMEPATEVLGLDQT